MKAYANVMYSDMQGSLSVFRRTIGKVSGKICTDCGDNGLNCLEVISGDSKVNDTYSCVEAQRISTDCGNFGLQRFLVQYDWCGILCYVRSLLSQTTDELTVFCLIKKEIRSVLCLSR